MIELLLLAGLAGGAGLEPVPADTLVAVRRGTSFRVENFAGRIVVEGWERDEVEVLPRGGRRREAAIRVSDRSVLLRGGNRSSRYAYEVRVPSWMALELQGADLDVRVEGVDGRVDIQTLEGDVGVEGGGAGGIDVRTVDGVVRISGVRGDVTAWSGDGDVFVDGVRGSVHAESVDGDVVLDDVAGDVVRGSTVDGDVWYTGPVGAGARIELVTHDGDIEVDPMGAIDAVVAVSTFDGEFESEFPITLERFDGGDEFRFTLGAGRGQLVLQAFDGSIRLREPR